ncbi:MAG: bifunctional UDP-sugar hydrolase/5'-nucleotidase [Beijerinckiaceae bacterium]
MQGFLRTVAVWLFVMLAPVAIAQPEATQKTASAPKKPHVTFVLVSDTYKMEEQRGRGGYARIAGAIKAERARGGTVIAIHAGDFLSPCLMCSFDGGQHVVDLMNGIGFDMVVPGNHEYDTGKDGYLKRMAEARFPVFAANLRFADGSPLPGHRDNMIIEAHGVKIGIVGLTAQDSHEKSNPGDLKIAGVRESLESQAKALRAAGAQLIVAVIHAVRTIDQEIYDKGIADVLLSGDDHDIRYIYNGKGVFLEGGEDGHYVQALDIVFENKPSAGARLRWSPRIRVIDTADVAPDATIAARVAHYQSLLGKELDVELASLAATLDSRSATVRSGEAAWGNLIADAVREATKADMAIMNGGGIRAGALYPAGSKLTRRHVLAELPFGNKTLVFRLRGKDIKAAMENGLAAYPRPSGQFLHVSGAKVRFDATRKPGERVVALEIGGAAVDPMKYYSVAASDFFLRGGDGFTQFTNSALRTRVEDAKLIANDVMIYVRKLGVVNARAEGRVTDK